MKRSYQLSNRGKGKSMVAVFILLASNMAATGGALAAIKPDFCLAINPGTNNVEIVFYPSKKNITHGPGSDGADYYQVSSTDGAFSRNVQPNEKKSLKHNSPGMSRSYQVQTMVNQGWHSKKQPCLSFDVVSSISPGKLRDWRRSGALVEHRLGDQALDTSERRFEGHDDDNIRTKISAAESARLNPAGGSFAYQARITLTGADLSKLASQSSPSWNVMQRGFSDSPGGLWKMSVVMAGTPKVPRAQCVARDNQPKGPTRGKLSANSTYELKAGVAATITCVVDDATNQIRVIVNGRTDNFSPTGGEAGFKNINPTSTGTNCAQEVAQSISVGNKPHCSNIRDNDRFQGTIHSARILKGS